MLETALVLFWNTMTVLSALLLLAGAVLSLFYWLAPSMAKVRRVGLIAAAALAGCNQNAPTVSPAVGVAPAPLESPSGGVRYVEPAPGSDSGFEVVDFSLG